jgi:hypothetical protein
MISPTDKNNKFSYHVAGIMEWILFGSTVNSQAKYYIGFALTK